MRHSNEEDKGRFLDGNYLNTNLFVTIAKGVTDLAGTLDLWRKPGQLVVETQCVNPLAHKRSWDKTLLQTKKTTIKRTTGRL